MEIAIEIELQSVAGGSDAQREAWKLATPCGPLSEAASTLLETVTVDRPETIFWTLADVTVVEPLGSVDSSTDVSTSPEALDTSSDTELASPILDEGMTMVSVLLVLMPGPDGGDAN